MHFYPHNIADFNNATRHLTRVERSVYRDAIDLYYDTEQPLQSCNFDKLCRVLLCVTDEEKQALRTVLDEFFELTEVGHFHSRCNAEIEKYRLNSSAKARAGKASAEARKNRSIAPVEHVLNSVEQTNNQELINNKQELNIIAPKNKFSDEDKKCALWLADKLVEFIPDCKKPNIDGWSEHVRKMREIDNRDHKEICQLWIWCRKDSFESANVQSPEKLRKRYDQLKTKMKLPATGANYGAYKQTNQQRGLDPDDTSWADRVFGAGSSAGGSVVESGIQIIEGDFSSLGSSNP